MSKKTRTIFRYTLSFLLAFVFLYFAFRGVEFSDLWDSLKGANYWIVALLVPLNILLNWIKAERWYHLLAPIKAKTSKRNLFAGVMIGYAINNVLPRVGEVVRPYVVGKQEGIPVSSTLGTVIVERILDFMSFYFIVCIVLFIYPNALDSFVSNPSAMRPVFLAASAGLLGIFIMLFFHAESFFRFIAKLTRFVPKKYSAKIDGMLESFYNGFAVSRMKNKFFIIVFQSFVIWGINALIMFIPFYAFPELVRAGMDFGASVVLLVVSSVAWILPAPGAMGTYHSFLNEAMTKLFGISRATALSYAIVTHEVGYLVVNVIGAYYYFHDHLKFSELKKAAGNGGSGGE
jgi:uncharacterized protein (TIRG00374 family)